MINRNNSSRYKNITFILWVIFFCYALCAALIFQNLILPHLSSMQTGSGLINNDATYFNSVATSLANEIKIHGWSSWRLYPAEGAPGNVAILGALYAFFGHDPSLAIPINAAIHALGGALIFLLARELATKESIGTYAGVIAGSLFIIFPSALIWYGQNHKDGYAIAGMLLTLYVWVKAIQTPMNNRHWGWLLLGNLAAMTLVGIVRPFGLKLLLIAALGALVAILISAVIKGKVSAKKKLVGFFIVSIAMLIGATRITVALGGLQSDASYANWQGETVNVKGENADILNKIYRNWQWSNSPLLPDSIEQYIDAAARTRAGLVVYGLSVNAKSMLDIEIAPKDIGEVAYYLPRAFQIALLAPFPSSWLANVSMTRLAAAGEMFVYYLCLPGILLLFFYNRKSTVLMTLYFATFFLLIYGFTQANLGTLYRYRYGYLFVILMLGVLGWFTWLDKTGRFQRLLYFLRPHAPSIPVEETLVIRQPIGRKRVIGSGFIVMVLTLLYFIGFFIRDIMMAKDFGLGSTLDSYFIALLIPMFIATVMCTPLGIALVPVYLDVKERHNSNIAKVLVSNVTSWSVLFLLVICLIVYLFGPNLLSHFYFSKSVLDMPELIPLLNLALPLLLLGGVVILGSSVLNANGRAVLASTAQLIVPIVAILALLLFGDRYGVRAVMIGMVIGLFLNLLIVQFFLRDSDASLLARPTFSNHSELSLLLRQYLPLAVSAFFVAVAVPMATLLAISLPDGNVSAFNLGNKVVLFVTGLISTAISTVILPYFATMVAKNRLISARRELSFFLLFVTFVSVPISAGLYIWSEPIIRLIFEGGTFNRESTELVTRVMQYSVVQLPFFVCNALLLKFATATKHVFAICVAAIMGLLINIGASLFLMQYMGVAGIALGASLSIILSTVLLVLILVRYWHISRFDALIMLLNWLIFGTLLMSLHFRSEPSAFITILAYVILLAAYLNSLNSNKILIQN